MSETILQIKRSTTTALPANLQPGELAYTSNGQVLFIGSPEGANTANVIAIAGERFPGVLTANQALVANSSAWIDNIQTAKLILGPPATTVNVTSITTDGNLTSVSNTSLVTSWAIKSYIDTQAGSSTLGGLSDVTITSPSNNQLLIYDNVSGQWENHSISGTTNEVTVTFDNNDITVGLPDNVTITSNLSVTNHLSTNTAAISSTGASSNTTTGALTVAGGLGVAQKINAAELAVGNTSVYTSVNSSSVSTNNVFATGTVNGNVLSVGGWVVANQSGVFTTGGVDAAVISIGTAFYANATQLTFGNTSVNSQILSTNVNFNGLRLHVGDATNNTVITGTSVNTTGNVNITGSANVGSHIHVGSDLLINTSTLFIGNSTVNTTVNSSAIFTSTFQVANLVSTGNTTINGNLIVEGDTTLGNNVSDNINFVGKANSNILPASNTTYNLGSSDLQFANVYANNIVGMNGVFHNDVSVSGNLTVTGSLVTINVSTLSIIDPLIQLASNNTVGDSIDIGFFGSFNTGGGAHEHAGLFRDATDGVFKLFTNLEPSPTTTVDTSNGTYAVATLNAYLESGALLTNSSSLSITANSTVNVSITANSLTLATALTVPNGGTGQTTFTNNAVLLGNTAGALRTVTSSTTGHVLQINSSGVPVFAMLDGGTF